MQQLRVAVIGLGKMGLLHTGILSSMPDVELVALCDQKKLLINLAKKILKKVTVVNDIQKLSPLELDAVFVTTPIPSHYPVIKSIYTNKIAQHVFVEKTLSWRFDEAERICQAAQDLHGVNMVGYQKRYSVTFRKALSLLNEGALGSLKSFKAYSYSSDFIGLQPEAAAKLFSSRGGVLRDLGSHAISLALWYFGNMTVISDSPREKSSIQESCVSFKVKAGDIDGYVEASWRKADYRLPETGLSVVGSNGTLSVNDDKVAIKYADGKAQSWYRQDLDDKVAFVLWAPEYYREDAHFVKCSLAHQSASPDFFEASIVDRIIKKVTP